MRTPRTESGAVTIKIWRDTYSHLVKLNAYVIMRDRQRRSMTDVLNEEIEKAYRGYISGQTPITVAPLDPTKRNQVPARISSTAYDHLLIVQAHLMLQTQRPVNMLKTVHSIVVNALKEFES